MNYSRTDVYYNANAAAKLTYPQEISMIIAKFTAIKFTAINFPLGSGLLELSL